ncbi:MAG: S46 family peptidase [Burkholderiales bacterium]|nr:S46 family peptidase [Burkholderiales bacterium]
MTGSPLSTISIAMAIGMAIPAQADEGMWTFDHPPLQRIEQQYGIKLTPDWLNKLQGAAVKFGASGSFVSADGLMLTNHHVALDCIAQLSSPGHDLQQHGFVAATQTEELRCPGATARVLESTEDVTDTILHVAPANADADTVTRARKAAIAKVEDDCASKTGMRCQVVPLYSGSIFHLYRYRQWDDVRLAFAPEFQAAFFGGDADNFVYPRFALDFALLRIYDHGQPVHPAHYLKLATAPVAEGDAIFVVGNPGRTSRLFTIAELEQLRDVRMPLMLAGARAQQAALHAYAARSPEAARQAVQPLFDVENWLKSMNGEMAALNDPSLMARKASEEAAFRQAYAAHGLKGDPWRDVEHIVQRKSAKEKELWTVWYGHRTLFDTAGHIVEMAYERALPESERMGEYRDLSLRDTDRRLRADQPVYKDMDIVLQTHFFTEARSLLGDAHPFVKAVLHGETPAQSAERLIRATHVDDVNERRRLLDGGIAAVEASTDPLIQLARTVYPMRRALVRFSETEIDTPIIEAASKLGQARFTLYGTAVPPDATGTLRLSYGKVAGYDAAGIATPWKSTFGGLNARSDAFDHKAPFDLPAQLDAARSKIDPRTPLDFVTTADIIGGNSGSPVVNVQGDWVGLIFDGNLEGLGGRFIYTDERARSLAVSAEAILTALDKVYGASTLARELRGQPSSAAASTGGTHGG